MAATQYYGTGRRKTSTARVFLRPGTGAITINYRPIEASFPTETLRLVIRQPLVVTELAEDPRQRARGVGALEGLYRSAERGGQTSVRRRGPRWWRRAPAPATPARPATGTAGVQNAR